MKNNDKIISKNGFDISWKPTESKTTKDDDGFCSAREWQKDAFALLKDSDRMILNAPMGSGKSWMICFLSAYKMHQIPSLRCIIAVPQTIIASGFMDAKLKLPNGEKLIWSPFNNLCDENTKSETTKYVIQWLETAQADFNNRILICTHATLVAVYKQLQKKEKISLFQDILLWIDEAHHAKTSFLKGDNSIGFLINDLIKKEDLRVQLGLTTATFFRGDRHCLISQDIEALFIRYNLPFDQYLQSMKYLKSFKFDFIICGKDYTKALKMTLDQRKAKDIIYIPKPKSRHSKGCKYSEVNEIVDIYQAKDKSKVSEDIETGLTLLNSNNNDIRILDLVNEDRRGAKKAFLSNKKLQKDKDHLDVIIALDMFKEGANWIFADRCIIIGPRGSLVDVIQMIGRLFRDAPNKEHVEVVQLLPFSVSQNSEDLMKNLNNYLKAICFSLLLEDILKPIKILTPREEVDKKQKISNEPLKELRLHEIISDENERKDVLNKATTHLINLSSDYEDKKMTIMETYNEFQKSLPLALECDKEKTTYEVKLIGDHVWSLFLRDTLKMKGMDVENIDFQIINEVYPLEGLLRFTSIHCNIDSFTRLRAAIANNRSPLTIELILEWVKDHYNKHGIYPKRTSGIIEFAKGKYEGTTWAHVDTALSEGLRGLPKGSSLPKFLEEKFGVKNNMNLPPFSNELIEGWCILFYKKYGIYPKRTSGIIEFADGKYAGITWDLVDTALQTAGRGLKEKSSLPKFLEEKFGVKNNMNLPPFSNELIEGWCILFYKKYGIYPKRTSGIIEFAEGEYEGTTWKIVDRSLVQSGRGLIGYSSLPKFLEEKFSVKNKKNLPHFTNELIEGWCILFYKKFGIYPKRTSGIIEFAEGKYAGITWALVDTALQTAGRGLKEKSSLPKFLEEKFGVKNKMNLPRLSSQMIEGWCILFYKKYGIYPKRTSGIIEFAEGEYKGTTWSHVNNALLEGLRGLQKGSSLKMFLKEKFNLRHIKELPPYTEDLIIEFIQEYHDKVGKYPKYKSGTIITSRKEHSEDTWASIDHALRTGSRGLSRGSSLAKFIKNKIEYKLYLHV